MHCILNLQINTNFFDDTLFNSHNNILFWFLPELFEMDLYDPNNDKLITKYPNSIKFYLPNKIDEYKKMRDSGEPDDIITRASRNDDINTFQSLISMNNIDISESYVQFNIFEDFIQNGNTNYLNYSAAYGSVHCFKFLLLNHMKIDESTFEYAIYGGNIEIIKIVEQNIKDYDDENIINIISIPIKMHRNDLFDWIFEQKIDSSKVKKETLSLISQCSSANGNIHSISAIINKGFFSSLIHIFYSSSENGFYTISQRIYNIMTSTGEKLRYYDKRNSIGSVSFGNLSIFIMYSELNSDPTFLLHSLILATKMGYSSIIQHIINIISETKSFIYFTFLPRHLIEVLGKAKTNLVFDYLMINCKTYFQSIIKNHYTTKSIIKKACKSGNLNVIKSFIPYLDKSHFDFTNSFFVAALSNSFEICKYLIELKLVKFDYLSIASFELSMVDANIFSMILQNCKTIEKQLFLNLCIYPAIENHNYQLVDLLLKEKAPYNDSLFIAVNNHDIKMIIIILKYHKESSFINMRKSNETALSIAVKNNDLLTVKCLISIPEINLSFDNNEENNPICIAIQNKNVEICKLILNSVFQDKNLQNLQIMLSDFLVKYLLNYLQDYRKDEHLKTIAINNLIIEYVGTYYNCISLLRKAWYNKDIKMIEHLCKIDRLDQQMIKSLNSKVLLENTFQDINYMNNQNDNLINHQFFESKGRDAKQFCSNKNLDVNYVIYSQPTNKGIIEKDLKEIIYSSNQRLFETVLMNAVRLNDIEKIDIIISHSSFDKAKSHLKYALYNSFNGKKYQVLMKLIDIINDEDINNYTYNGNTLFNLAVISHDIIIINQIIKRNFKINPKFIQKAIIQSLKINEKSFDIINAIIEYDKYHDHCIKFNELLQTGKSFFTSLEYEHLGFDQINDFEKIIALFIKNGVDPNAKDKGLHYPLEYAIRLDSYKFVLSLINSNKIDFSQKMLGFGTYLHLAAGYSKNPKILKEFLMRKLIDINSVDDRNKTPL